MSDDSLDVVDGTEVLDESKPPVPPRSKKDVLKALPTATEAGTKKKGAPAEQEMSRVSSSMPDPVRVLTSMTEKQLREAREMDMEDLSEFFRKLGLKELPELILRNQLNGSVLHQVSAEDVHRMDFHSLGEAKAFQNLCSKMNQIERGEQREEAVMVRRLVFWGEVHEWHPGKCDMFNRCEMRDKRDGCQKCWDFMTCSPKTLQTLPESSIILYRDHLCISTPMWVESVVEKRYHELNKAFANPNVASHKMIVDNIDYSNISDVDLEETPNIKEYQKTCADCGKICCCSSLMREPGNGNYYWVSAWQVCCGFTHRYRERPDGVVTIRLRQPDERGAVRRIGVFEGSSELTRTMLNYIEESQIKKGLRVNVI